MTASAAGTLADGIGHALWMIDDIKTRNPEVAEEGWHELDAIRAHLLGTLVAAEDGGQEAET